MTKGILLFYVIAFLALNMQALYAQTTNVPDTLKGTHLKDTISHLPQMPAPANGMMNDYKGKINPAFCVRFAKNYFTRMTHFPLDKKFRVVVL